MSAVRSALVVLGLSFAPTAFAQPAPTPEEVQQAQARWSEGKAYFDAGNFEAARVAFKQAYTIFPHAAFLQNLGEAEFRAGRNVEASRHFTAFLRASGSPAQRELAKKSLTKASERLGSIVVTTNVDDAEIRVDDEVVGRSPLGSLAWYVEPGRHIVTARKEGYLDGAERVDVSAGAPKSVMVRVQRVVGGTSESEPEEAKQGATPQRSPGAAKGLASPGLSHAASSTAENHRSGLQPRTVVLIGGAAFTVAGIALGTVYSLRTISDSSRINDALAKLVDKDACYPPPDPSVVDLCRSVDDQVALRQTDRTVRNAAFIGAGLFGAATLATLIFWRNRPATAVSVAPSFARDTQGVLVWGQF